MSEVVVCAKDSLLDLFSGSQSVSSVAREMGFATLTVDKFIEADLTIGIEQLTKEMIIDRIGYPTAIWASPVCSAWSKTGWYHHWNTKIYAETKRFVPKTPFASESIEMVRKTIEVFSWFPDATFWMENPQGLLYRHPVLNTFLKYGIIDVKRHLITYCQYGCSVQKPTHIWTNSKTWIPRPPCMMGDPCHQYAPRNSQAGTRGQTDSFERSKIPQQLCKEIIRSIKVLSHS